MLCTSPLCKTASVDLPPPAASVLNQPTRARLFSALQDARRSTPTEELAVTVGMHVNGVRRHLELLRGAGLVERRRTRRARGRPRDEWSVAATANPGGEAPSGYGDLATWLVRAIPAGPEGLREVEQAGREIGRGLAPLDAESPGDAFEQSLISLGFQPETESLADGSVSCRLRNCPYRDSVRESAEVVCTLHKGITAGLLDVIAPESRLSGFEPHDPDTAGCLVEVTGADWASAANGEHQA